MTSSLRSRPSDAGDSVAVLAELHGEVTAGPQARVLPHLPQRRAEPSAVEPSIVVQNPESAEPARRRGSSERTVVDRDRESLRVVRERIRRDELRSQRLRKLGGWALLGAAIVAAFVVGVVLTLWIAGTGASEASAPPEGATGDSPREVWE